MYFLSHTLYVCYFSILIRLINGYFLIAANLDDFRALAKKLAPDTLAESLRSLAYRPSVRQKDESADFDANSDEFEDDNENLPPIKGTKVLHAPIRGTKGNHKSEEIFEVDHGKKVDFEELVEKVKKRLALELKSTYLDRRKEADVAGLNIKTKRDDKISSVENSDKDVAKPKKQGKNKQKGRFSTEEMSTFADEPDYNIIEDKYNKPKENNDKTSTDNKHNKNVATSKKLNDQFNIEEISPFGDMPDYKEDISNEPQMNSDSKTVKNIDEYEDALKDANVKSKKINAGKKNPNKVVKHLKPNGNKFTTKSYDLVVNLYKKMDMTQKDSYEDYVTPAKEKNVFISTESKEKNTEENHNNYKHNVPNKKRYKIKSNRQSYNKFNDKNMKNRHGKPSKTPFKDNLKALNNVYLKKEHSKTDREKFIGSDEMKAKTENLWYKNDKKLTDKTVDSTSKKSNLNTKLPRRYTYKMATPNYLSKLPVVVEKYDFDEPLPERDREREDLKDIGNPPARVNKKIRL